MNAISDFVAQPAQEDRSLTGNSRGGLSTAARFFERSSKASLRLRMYSSLVLVDVLAMLVGFLTLNSLWLGSISAAAGLEILAVMIPIYLVIAFQGASYSLEVLQKPRVGVARAIRAMALAFALVLGALFFLKASGEFSRFVLAGGTISAMLLSGLGRVVLGTRVGNKCRWRFTNEILLVDGTAVYPQHGEIVIFAEQAQLFPATDDPVLMDRIGRLLKHCDRVILACPRERRALWTTILKGVDVNVEVMAPEVDELGALQISRFGQQSTLLISRGPLSLRERLAKRTLDLFLTTIAIIAFAPAFIAIATAIKLDSKGPVFFRQPRMGKSNRVFHIFKFRSMRASTADASGVRSASRDDNRITRVGAFLRRTSLDELPQLFNVLIGDMSLVGPRPHALGSTAEDELFWKIDERYWERHVIKPGITGLAQVRGFRGATHVRSDLSNRVQADLEYVTNWSLMRDIGIMLRTARVLLHENAF